ncbi:MULTISPECIES: hypothetical protein [Streptomyces]|uniref:Uncharacterized protein n=1 Tax=Streptomyces rimosus subsp. rimosus (strain ATCC 10970 / DSM 40260 / JCM 4667 / NRRL 2234) TaxID=1265868 RepID=A0A8A1UMT2_STRR1|nr:MULTISPECIES: hypothetical protein [Streptomyces]MYT41190.1 hypothetical protein [Streptomyces sp. SID5471]QGY69169.1 hypothetical protein V519_027710 [Streptomyces rimosus R6-500]QST80811.1 hypothetical protein SRIM_012025 [Streptomyces rimosus subsp. rimosus ATCC 10970]
MADTCSNRCSATDDLAEVHEADLSGPGWVLLLCQPCAEQPPWSLTEGEWQQFLSKSRR